MPQIKFIPTNIYLARTGPGAGDGRWIMSPNLRQEWCWCQSNWGQLTIEGSRCECRMKGRGRIRYWRPDLLNKRLATQVKEKSKSSSRGKSKGGHGPCANTPHEHSCPLSLHMLPFLSQRNPSEVKGLRAEQTVRVCFQSIYFHLVKYKCWKIFEKRKSVIKCTCSIDTPCLFKTLKWYQ